MESGIITLKPLYDYIKTNDREGFGLRPRSQQRREYNKIAKDITQGINKKNGLYLWGKYWKKNKDADYLWTSIYLGRAENLQERICGELTGEREFIYECVFLKEQILLLLQQHYGWKYIDYWERELRKIQTTHIIWVSVPENRQMKDIENDLIETLNPTANAHFTRPQVDIYNQTSEIITLFRQRIHENRVNGYNIYLQDNNP